MNYYYVDLVDEPKTSWILFDVVKKLPPHPKKPELAPAFYKFFQFPDAQVVLKPQFESIVCRKCGRYEADKAFNIGFEEPVAVRLKGEFGYTTDRMFVINDKVLKALKKAGVGGYETKALGRSGWHALRAKVQVDCFDPALKKDKKRCPACGVSLSMGVLFERVSQLALPSGTNLFFTTKKNWPHCPSNERELFLTEDVVEALKAGKVKGPYCTRLLTDEEVKMAAAKEKQGLSWKPPKATVFLSGK